MVPAGSRRIPRAPRYSGACSSWGRSSGTGLSPSAVRLSRSLPLTFPSVFVAGPTTPAAASTAPVWALALSLATTRAITFVFSSSGYLDVSVPRVRLPHRGMPESLPAGCPIRKSAGLWVFAPLRGLSQLVTSFFASESHRHPSCALLSFPCFLQGKGPLLFFPMLCSFLRSTVVSRCCLRYLPMCQCALSWVGPGRVELPTSTLSV